MNKLPLEGIRVLDFTVVWAGPFAAMLLADYGAEVIRVESLRYFPSVTRGLMPHPDQAIIRTMPGYGAAYPDRDPGARPWNRHPMFNPHARNKLGMTVDLSRAKGRELFAQLVSISDVLIENHSARFMENLGLTYEVLSRRKPDLIMVSMPAFGMSGPYKYYQGFGINVESICGLTWLRAYPDADLTDTSSTLHMDAVSGAGAGFAIMAALLYRRRTGKGQFIDFAQAENLMQSIGETLMDYTMNGRVQTSLGNRHPMMAPHGCYPCHRQRLGVGAFLSGARESGLGLRSTLCRRRQSLSTSGCIRRAYCRLDAAASCMGDYGLATTGRYRCRSGDA